MAESKAPAAARKESGSEKDGDSLPPLVCNVHFNNTLPAIPFPPKALPFPFDPMRFVKYTETSLERNYKYKLLLPNNGAPSVELLDTSAYATPAGAMLAGADEALVNVSASAEQEQRKQLLESSKPWLRKGEIIATDVRVYGRAASGVDNKFRVEGDEDFFNKDRDAQIAVINESFEKAKHPPSHPTRKELTVAEIMPILPDQKLWWYGFSQVVFDNDPAPTRLAGERVERLQLEQALIRGEKDTVSKEDFVAYFLPSRESAKRRRRARDAPNDVLDLEETFDYSKVREYAYDVRKREETKEDAYFFVFRTEDGLSQACYNEVPKRIRLTARRKADKAARIALHVRHRGFTDSEIKGQDLRGNLLAGGEEEERMEGEGEGTQAAEAES